MAKILIVEDDTDIVMALEEDLRRQGHQTRVAADGVAGLSLGRDETWDLMLIDVMLPRMDGFDVCSELRKAGVRAPIILLTARTLDSDKELGLDSGADDYVTKPFSLRELRARVRAHLRRSARDDARLYRFGLYALDLDRAELTRGGQRVDLTPHEFRLLSALLRNRGRVLSRSKLIEAAWEPGIAVTDRTVDTHVFNLRQKIEAAPSEPVFLKGVRGFGYRFEDED